MEEFTIDSRDMKTKLAAYQWTPKGEVRAVLILVHGMSEHMGRYDEMASYFAAKGILVAGIDLLGHGRSVKDPDDFGYFCERDAATVVVRDVHRLKKTVQEKNPGIPVFLFGHSMGSYIARNYIERYGTGIQGVILQGGGDDPMIKLKFGRILSTLVGKIRGEHYRSRLCAYLTLSSFVKSVKGGESVNSWICNNPEVVRAYDNDPLSGFLFTANGYQTLTEFSIRSIDKKLMGSVPSSLPMYIISGKDDPVGQMGEGVKRMYEKYKAAGIENIRMELVEGARHEIHNEAMRYEIFDRIIGFILEFA
ncbi:MAG: alpha/beta hydrolase [Lachnospiraceae bacterium]|nr:alpha/beta hydrolase [Lachnospiraceae bacterium]